MAVDLSAARAFVAVAAAGGFRDAASITGMSASSLSVSVKRLEDQLGLRLLNRTTRSVVPTEAGSHLLAKLQAAIGEVEAAFDGLNEHRATPSGTIRLNVPLNAARLILPRLLPGFLAAHPAVNVEIIAMHEVTDVIAEGCDAGIRYDERLTKDMITVPIGPRRQRFATAASPAYLAERGRPRHPKDLLDHACLPARSGGGPMIAWTFSRDGERHRISPKGSLVVDPASIDLAVSAAIAGCGIIHLFEDWLRPHLKSGALDGVLEPWWESFDGPRLYFHGRDHVPAALKAFIDYIRQNSW